MQITPIKLAVLTPPKDDLFLKIKQSKLRLKDGGVLAVSSKVVSIHEGRCVKASSTDKDTLAKREADIFLERKYVPGKNALHTITHNILIRSAGIDESNGNGFYILWPKDPMRSAAQVRRALMRAYKLKKLGVIITDSISTPLRRGAVGFALAWAGFDPLYDYRGEKDLFGREFQFEQTNYADALAAGAVAVMGEGSEQTPLAVIRNAPAHIWHSRHSKLGFRSFNVPLKEDLFAPFLTKAKWKKGAR